MCHPDDVFLQPAVLSLHISWYIDRLHSVTILITDISGIPVLIDNSLTMWHGLPLSSRQKLAVLDYSTCEFILFKVPNSTLNYLS